MSLFDAIFEMSSAAHFDHFAREGVATITIGDQRLPPVDCIVRHAEGIEEPQDYHVTKRVAVEVDFLTKDFGQMVTGAGVELEGSELEEFAGSWTISRFVNRTMTYSRYELVRRYSREISKRGFRETS